MATPTNVQVQQASQQATISWDLVPGVATYSVLKSEDGVNFIFGPYPVSGVTFYLDNTVTNGTKYWYQVAAVVAGTPGPYVTGNPVVPAPNGEMSLVELRQRAKERADRVNSQFLTDREWNSNINQAMYELYDILTTSYEDYFLAPPLQITMTGNQATYPLPDGVNYNKAPAYYKLSGVDLGLSTANNAWVTVDKYDFIDRNNYVYPNSNSTIYGVFNLQYRVMGQNIMFIPTPTSGQTIQLWYIPRLKPLLLDTDISTIGYSGWLEYVIVRAAALALTKEESDISSCVAQLQLLTARIQAAAQNRDNGKPDTISNIRAWGNWGGSGPFNGFHGGW